MDKSKFGKFIAERRRYKGMTQKELADKINLTDKAISKWERGLSFPDVSLIEDLAELLDVSVVELLQGELRKKDTPITMKEAEQLVDHSLSISDEEIARKHTKNKIVFLIGGMVVMLLISIVLNIWNYTSQNLNNASNKEILSRYAAAYDLQDTSNGEVVFKKPRAALEQIIQDIEHANIDPNVANYLKILNHTYEGGAK